MAETLICPETTYLQKPFASKTSDKPINEHISAAEKDLSSESWRDWVEYEEKYYEYRYFVEIDFEDSPKFEYTELTIKDEELDIFFDPQNEVQSRVAFKVPKKTFSSEKSAEIKFRWDNDSESLYADLQSDAVRVSYNLT